MRHLLATATASGLLLAGLFVASTSATADPRMLAAMKRDLHLTADQATARLAADDRAGRVAGRLRDELGADFAGAWMNGDEVVVAVTDRTKAAEVRTAGARATLVARSQSTLDGLKAKLDGFAAGAPRSVLGWHVDVVTNTVVVTTAGDTAAARAFAERSGAPAGAVRVLVSRQAPRPMADIRGGDAYNIDGKFRCSVGFAVAGGFVTAGHCGRFGSTATGADATPLGRFRGSSFPFNDYAWVATGPAWTPRGTVNNYRGGTVPVAGSQEAPVGASVCRSGSTTGWHCGTIQAKNATVRYPEGFVTGLTQTNVCAEPGDSGGSWVTGNQAQGVTSGGTGDCTSGGTIYFQPVNEILNRYHLRLITT